MQSKAVILMGSGGHAKVMLALLQRLAIPVLGLVDPHLAVGETALGVTCLGADDAILRFSPAEVALVNGIGALPHDKGLRIQLFDTFTACGYQFMTLVDPSAILVAPVELSAGVQILAGAIIQAGAVIADNCIINSGAIVEHDCQIGRHTHLAPGVVLSGGVTLGEQVHVGTSAVIIQNIAVGSYAIIGAGSIITQAVAANHIVYPPRMTVRLRQK